MIRNPVSSSSFQSIKVLLAICLSLVLAACSNHYSADPESSTSQPIICSGFGCSTSPGKLPSRMETHKATKEEKIRARRGESPDFGSGEWSVGGPIKF